VPSRIDGKLRVGFVSSFPPTKCGVASYSARLVRELGKRADLVVIADVSQDEGLNDPPYVLRVWRRNSLFYPFTIFWHVIRQRVDVVHIQHEYLLYGDPYHSGLFPILPLLLRLLDKKVVITMHSVVPRKSLTPEFFEKYGIGRRFSTLKKLCTIAVTKMIGFFASTLIVHNKISKETLIRDYRFKPEKIHVIPHGVEVKETNITQREAKRKLGLEGLNVLLFFGFIKPGKGLEHLIKALPKILKEHPNTKLLIAGGGHPHVDEWADSYARKIQDLIDQLGVKDAILMTGGFVPEEDVPIYITAADICIMPYDQNEIISASGVLQIYASHGKPLVAAKVYQTSELTHGVNALLVPPKDPNHLSQAVIKLLSNTELKMKLGRSIRRLAEENGWKNVAKKTLNLYKEVARR